MTNLRLIALTVLFSFSGTPPAKSEEHQNSVESFHIPFNEFTLSNGLKVIVHTDSASPLVAVNLTYRVGSKDDPTGLTGLTRLSRALMSSSVPNIPGALVESFGEAGVSQQGSAVSVDSTSFFEVVPTTSLDRALFVESDRMGYLIGTLDLAKVDKTRQSVIKNVKESQEGFYGQASVVLRKQIYPVGHPYRHTTYGLVTDLNAASLSDVQAWLATRYGPNNAVLVLAGDIDLATAKDKVERYFGDIPSAPRLEEERIPAITVLADSRSILTDEAPDALLIRRWIVPGSGNSDSEQLKLLAHILADDVDSRLDVRLRQQDKSVRGVQSDVFGSKLNSVFGIQAIVEKNANVEDIEKSIQDVFRKVLAEGPTQAEIDRAVIAVKASRYRELETIASRAKALAECATVDGDTECVKSSLDVLTTATPESVRAAGARWLIHGSHTLFASPGSRMPLTEDPTDASSLRTPLVADLGTISPQTRNRNVPIPQADSFPELTFPKFQHGHLENGSNVILVERHGIPVVRFRYVFNGGYASDAKFKLGTAALATFVAQNGAGALTSKEFRSRVFVLGADMHTRSSLLGTSFDMYAIHSGLDESLGLYAKAIRGPRFDRDEIDRTKKQLEVSRRRDVFCRTR